MIKIDWFKFLFISKGNWFKKGEEAFCIVTYSEPKMTDSVNDNSGLFEGKTIIGNAILGSNSDACPFSDFDIYYNNIRVNDLTYIDLFKLMEGNE